MKRICSAILVGGLLGAQAHPALAMRGGAGEGPRGGTAEHEQGPDRSGTAVQGPHGGTAEHEQGPNRSGTAVQGPHGGTAEHEQGPYGSHTAVEGPNGRTAYSHESYNWNGAHYSRPAWNSTQVNVYQHGFVGYPGFQPYSSFGLVAPLAAFSSLAFLSAGMLIGTYAAEQNKTVYVYIVNQGGTQMEYRVNSAGQVVSSKPVS